MAASVIASNTDAFTASGPTVSASWTPQAGDVLVALVSASNSAAISTIPSGWSDVGPGLVTPGDTTCYLAALCHTVTADEASASTTSWSLSGLFAASEAGEWMLAVLRGADPITPIDTSGSWTQASIASPHTLAGLAGADLSTDSLVLSGIIGDAPTITYTDPSGWTALSSGAGTNTARWFGYRTALTTAGVDVAATTITPSVGDEGLSITVAITAGTSTTTSGTLTASMPLVVGAVSGQSINPGTVTAATPKTTGALTAASVNPATVAASLPVLAGTLSGTQTNPATLAGTLPKVLGTLSDQTVNSATLSGTLPVVTAALTGTSTNPGTLTSTLPAALGTLTGTSRNPGTAAGTLPTVTGTLTGVSLLQGLLVATLPLLHGTLRDVPENAGTPVKDARLTLTVQPGRLALTTQPGRMEITT